MMILMAFLTINIVFVEDVEGMLTNRDMRELFEAMNCPETGVWFNTSIYLCGDAHIVSIVVNNSHNKHYLSSYYSFIAY